VVVKTAVAIGLLVETKVPVQLHASLVTTLMTAQLAMVVRHTTQIVRRTVTAMEQLAQSVLLTVTVIHVRHAMTAMHVQRVVTMNANLVLLVTAKTVRHVQVLVVASATATVQSVLHTASQIHHVSKTATQSVVHGLRTETPIVRTAQHAMIHANHLSVVHVTQTQTRRLSSKTRFLSV
jgi:hypothetical protein